MAITEQQQHKDSNRAVEMRILTLNVWGIPYISTDRHARIEAIAHQIATSHEAFHFVFLQELWSKDDYRFIAEKVAKVLPFSHYFYSGVIGSGTCIFSCTPIHEVHYQPYSLNGYPHKILHGDWFGGKGVGLCRTIFQGIPLLLVNTHLHAEYNYKTDEYIHHRVVQAFEASQLLRFTALDRHLVIFAGDFNCCSNDVPFRLLTCNTDFIDSFCDCPAKPADGVGATNGTPSNSYTPVAALRQDPNGKRLDCILYKSSPEYQIKTRIHDQPWPPRIPQKDFSFSDHEAVRTVLTIKPRLLEDEEAKEDTICFNRTDALLDASAVCTHGLRMVARNQQIYSWCSLIMGLVLAVLLGLYFLNMSAVAQFFYTLLVLFVFCLFLFTCFMAVLFCNHEYSSLMATKLGLERLLEEVRLKNARYFEEQKKKAQSAVLQS